MLEVQGILETALYVSDLRRAVDFYQKLFGFRALLESDRLIALDVAGRNVLLLFKEGATGEPANTSGGTIPAHPGKSGGHLAFSIASDEIEAWTRRLESEHIAVESLVTWPSGARSIYFRDLDGYLVELITPGFWSVY